MNCREFNSIAGDLADGRLMEAGAREAGLAHAGVCAACAGVLMGERRVGVALRAAASAETEEARARVKGSLLAAFAEQRKTLANPSPVIELKSRRSLRWWGFAAVAAAAVILISIALPSVMRVSPDASQVPPPPMTAGVRIPSEPTPATIDEGVTPPIPMGAVQSPVKRGASRARKRASVARGAAGRNETIARNAVNDYLPLTYLDAATAIESGTVVRVKLSRSALISLGMPVRVERADELMKAEVVLGDDGVARAIRLVR